MPSGGRTPADAAVRIRPRTPTIGRRGRAWLPSSGGLGLGGGRGWGWVNLQAGVGVGRIRQAECGGGMSETWGGGGGGVCVRSLRRQLSGENLRGV